MTLTFLTTLRIVVGFLVLQTARGLLFIGTHLSRVGWWLADREDMIRQQKTMIHVIKQALEQDGKA